MGAGDAILMLKNSYYRTLGSIIIAFKVKSSSNLGQGIFDCLKGKIKVVLAMGSRDKTSFKL